ncbi:MAG TPA: cell division protein FtsQ/DivIB [Solirubrobacterales bacterium]|nr:cell division protein FtsQ/DivIB [Solirubrobacterales bacterium]
MRRVALALVLLAAAAVAVYWFALRDSSTTTAKAQPTRPVAQIGEGKRVLLVAGDGRIVGSASGKSKDPLPVLPIKERPQGERVRGHVREQVGVLAAAPKALRHYVARTRYGKSGVDVEFTSGIEIRFGDDRGAERKWKAAAAVLADPSVTLLSYVDVHAPTHPSVGGEGHELPPAS